MARWAIRETDWEKIDTQTDEEIARNVASDPDTSPILTEAETAVGIVRAVRMKLGIS
jgi:hypothetical protein